MGLTVKTIESQREKQIPGKGDFISYRLTVTDGTTETPNVELFQKKESVPPEVGKTYENWSIETGQYGPKVKKEPRAGGFGGPPRQRDPKETAAIQRQHSQSVAVEYLIFRAQTDEEIPAEWLTRDGLRDLIDWFQRDIEWGVRLAEQPGYGKEPKRKDAVPTGRSDIPESAPSEFVHPEPRERQFS